MFENSLIVVNIKLDNARWFLRGLNKPFDPFAQKAMHDTMIGIANCTEAVWAYHIGNEIVLYLNPNAISRCKTIPYKLCVPKHFLNAAGSAPVTVIPVIAMLRNTPQDYFGQNLEVIPWRTIVQHLLSEDDEQCVRFVLRKWEAANPEEAAFGNPLGYKDVSRRRYAEKLDSIAMTYCLYGDLENILPREFSIAQI